MCYFEFTYRLSKEKYHLTGISNRSWRVAGSRTYTATNIHPQKMKPTENATVNGKEGFSLELKMLWNLMTQREKGELRNIRYRGWVTMEVVTGSWAEGMKKAYGGILVQLIYLLLYFTCLITQGNFHGDISLSSWKGLAFNGTLGQDNPLPVGRHC